MQIKLRRARKEEKDFLYQLHRTVYEAVVIQQLGAWDEQSQRGYFEDRWEQSEYRIIECAEQKIGTLCVTKHTDHIQLNEIQLLPQYQGKGIGSQLIVKELERIRDLRIPMRLRVLKENRARELYKRFGFAIYGETDTHFLMEKLP